MHLFRAFRQSRSNVIGRISVQRSTVARAPTSFSYSIHPQLLLLLLSDNFDIVEEEIE